MKITKYAHRGPMRAGSGSYRNAVGTLLLIVYTVIWLSGCMFALSEVSRTGELAISVGAAESERAGYHPASFVPGSYLFDGTGPDDRTFSVRSGVTRVSIPELVPGVWTIKVTVFTVDDVAVLTGEGVVTVQWGTPVRLNVNLQPVEGFGELRFELSWDPKLTVAPSAAVTLLTSDGREVPLTIPNGPPGSASATIKEIPTGTYAYSVVLNDSGVPTMGRADTVRVLAGVNSVISYEFADINKAGQAIPIVGSEFAVAWDPPSANTPDYYRLHYREHGAHTWKSVAETPAGTEPRFLVRDSMLPYGTYELAVSSVSGGLESALHTSMDDDADPSTGWYVVWSSR